MVALVVGYLYKMCTSFYALFILGLIVWGVGREVTPYTPSLTTFLCMTSGHLPILMGRGINRRKELTGQWKWRI